MPAQWTASGAAKLLSVFTGDGSVLAHDSRLMLLKEGWDDPSLGIPNPRTNTDYASLAGGGDWTAWETTFTGYLRRYVTHTGLTLDKMGTPTNVGTVVQLLNDTAFNWPITVITSPAQVISGAAIVASSSSATGTALTDVYAFTSFDENLTVGSSANQTVTIDVGALFFQLG